MDAARPEIGAVHPRARDAFEEVHAIFADFEQPQVRRHRADVHDVRTEVEHVVRNARQLGEQHAQILRTQRHFEIEQFLDREHIAMLHAQRRAIIEPVEIRQRLLVGLVLDQLLGAAVQQADMRVDPLDDFTVQLHHQTQNTVRGGMLRAKVDRVILNLDIADFGIFPVKAMFDLVEIFGHATTSECTATPAPFVSSDVEKQEPGARVGFSTSLETNGRRVLTGSALRQCRCPSKRRHRDWPAYRPHRAPPYRHRTAQCCRSSWAGSMPVWARQPHPP
ncbi:hypothetical protein D9M73_108390 [compost metagenome]